MSLGCKTCGKASGAFIHMFGHSYKSPIVKAYKPAKPTKVPKKTPKQSSKPPCKLCGGKPETHSIFGHAYQPVKKTRKPSPR